MPTRRTIYCVVAIGAMAITPTAVAVAKTPPPPRDTVTGEGDSFYDTHFNFNAFSDPANTVPGGDVSLKKNKQEEFPERKGPVTCLNVQGNRAVVGIKDKEPGHQTVYREFYIEDNGPTPKGGKPVDLLTGIRNSSTPPASTKCDSPMPKVGTGHLLRKGDLVVTDV